MKNKDKYTIEFLKKNNLILLEAISGSQAYGTNTPTSDTDIRGVFIMEEEDYLGLDYIDQVNDETNDTTYYEIGKFVRLLLTNNPNILELLNIPEDCLLGRHELMDLIRQEDFISKLCIKSFGGYATEQIKKARGLNKKIVNPVDKEKKTPLDYCYALVGHGSVPLRKWLQDNGMEQKFCGLVNVDHARDAYALFYDIDAYYCFSEKIEEKEREANKEHTKKIGKPLGLGYKGIEVDNSNTIRVSSVPEGQKSLIMVSYNKDGYTSYCKDYHDYWNWVEKRNEERYNVASNKGFDSKNMMHCFRLTEMAKEIATGKGIIVRRPNRDLLMSIRNGQMEYDELLDLAQKNLQEAEKLFSESTLMDAPDYGMANSVLIEIRKRFYNID